jgi:hypothetical protein
MRLSIINNANPGPGATQSFSTFLHFSILLVFDVYMNFYEDRISIVGKGEGM